MAEDLKQKLERLLGKPSQPSEPDTGDVAIEALRRNMMSPEEREYKDFQLRQAMTMPSRPVRENPLTPEEMALLNQKAREFGEKQPKEELDLAAIAGVIDRTPQIGESGLLADRDIQRFKKTRKYFNSGK